jgi:hypothetical protein
MPPPPGFHAETVSHDKHRRLHAVFEPAQHAAHARTFQSAYESAYFDAFPQCFQEVQQQQQKQQGQKTRKKQRNICPPLPPPPPPPPPAPLIASESTDSINQSNTVPASLPPLPPPPPTCFAIPGNHDWFDGLQTFLRRICYGDCLGGWYISEILVPAFIQVLSLMMQYIPFSCPLPLYVSHPQAPPAEQLVLCAASAARLVGIWPRQGARARH